MNRDELDAEDEALRTALEPVSPDQVPPGLEIRILSRIPKRRPRRLLRVLVPAALAAGAIAAAIASWREAPPRRPPPAAPVAGPLRFDVGPQQLSLPDGSRIVLANGADAEFRAVLGTRGLVRLHAGDVGCQASPGADPLLIEAPGLRARTHSATVIATTEPKEVDSMKTITAPAAALIFVLSGSVTVEDGPKPIPLNPEDVRHRRPNLRELVSVLAPAGASEEKSALREAPPAGEADAFALLRGRVLGADGAQPIEGAQVEIRREGSDSRVVVTNVDGMFEAGGLEEGGVQLVVRAAGHLDAETGVDLVAREMVEVLPIRLREERRIRGRVVDRFGAPVERVAVAVEPKDGDGSAQAHALGMSRARKIAYLQFDPPPDSDCPGATSQAECASCHSAAPHCATITIDGASLRVGLSPSFDVVYEPGTLLRRAWASHRTASESLGFVHRVGGPAAITGKGGRFEIGGLADGAFTLAASRPGWVDVSGPVSALAGADDVVLVIARGGEIRGTVFGPDGRPAAGARVNDVACDQEGRYRITGLAGGSVDLFAGPPEPKQVFLFDRSVLAGPSPPAKLLADSSLRIATRLVVEGDVAPQVELHAEKLAFSFAGEASPARLGVAVRRGVSVREGQVVERIDFHLPASRTIDGVVVDDVGLPLPGARVSFRPHEPLPYFGGQREAHTGADGGFRIDGVFDVSGRLSASSEEHLPGPAVEAGSAGNVLGVRLELPRAASLHGTTGERGAIELRDLDERTQGPVRLEIGGDSEEPHAFRIGALRPGRYRATFVPTAEGAVRIELGEVVLAAGQVTEIGTITTAGGRR